MALTRFPFAASLLLLPLLILASAADYSYSPELQDDKPNSQDYNYPPNSKSKDESKTKESYVYKLKSEDESKTKESFVFKSKVEYGYTYEQGRENHGYVSKSDEDKSKEEDNSYSHEVKYPKSNSINHDYTPNGYNSNSFPEKSKFEDTVNGSKPAFGHKSEDKEKKMYVSVEGLVYCKSSSDYYPLKGAVAKVTCKSVDGFGYKRAALTVYSCASDEKGYFSAKFLPSVLGHKVTECKAYLEKSPVQS